MRVLLLGEDRENEEMKSLLLCFVSGQNGVRASCQYVFPEVRIKIHVLDEEDNSQNL